MWIRLDSQEVFIDFSGNPIIRAYSDQGKTFEREYTDWDRTAQFSTFFKNAKESPEMEIFARAHSLNISCWVQDVINTCYEMDIAKHAKSIFKNASSE